MTWAWQGFEGPTAAVTAAKVTHDAMDISEVGAVVPARGQPPFAWNVAGTRAMFAVHTRVTSPLPCPPGLEEADPALVGRLVGA
jgi:hypothetical protein